MSSDRFALGCIAVALAVPLLSGGAAVWALLRYRQAHPEITVEPSPVQSTAPPLAAAPASTPLPIAPIPQPIEPVPAMPAPAIVATAVPVEVSVDVVFDAKIIGIEPKGVAPPGLAPGARCTLETTLAAVDRSDPHLTANLIVRCGTRRIAESDGVPAADTVKVIEQPGVVAGTYTYSLTLADGNVSIDTPHGNATSIIEGDDERTVSLVVANESRPLKKPLLGTTSETRLFHAGSVTNPGDDDTALGQVLSATGDLPLDVGAHCGLGFHYYGTIEGADKCDVLVVCGGVTVIGRPELFSASCKRQGGHVISASDPKPGSVDQDPALEMAGQKARIWNDLDGKRWSVTVGLNRNVEPSPARAPPARAPE